MPTPSPVKRRLVFSEILTSYLEKQRNELKGNQIKLQEFTKMVSPKDLKISRMIGEGSNFVSYKAIAQTKQNKSLKRVNNAMLGPCDNSRMCPGKIDTVTRNKIEYKKECYWQDEKLAH